MLILLISRAMSFLKMILILLNYKQEKHILFHYNMLQ